MIGVSLVFSLKYLVPQYYCNASQGICRPLRFNILLHLRYTRPTVRGCLACDEIELDYRPRFVFLDSRTLMFQGHEDCFARTSHSGCSARP
jgi:hypothetical protein